MKRMFLVLGAAVVMLPWLAGARVQADVIQWTASGSPLGPKFNPSGGTAHIYSQNFGVGSIALLPGNTTSGTNSGTVVALELSASINPDTFKIPTFGGPSANYSLSLMLHDAASGASGSLTFRGNLSGSIDSVFTHFTNTFLGPTTQSLTLGKDLYTVTVGPFIPPSDPNDPNGGGAPLGSISASISAQPAINSAPEPSSLMLACLGLPPLGLTRWFRRRKGVDGNASNA